MNHRAKYQQIKTIIVSRTTSRPLRLPPHSVHSSETETETTSPSITPAQWTEGKRTERKLQGRVAGKEKEECNNRNKSVPIQLAQCWFRALAIYNANIFKIKYRATEEILSNGTRKLLWFEISKMLTAS